MRPVYLRSVLRFGKKKHEISETCLVGRIAAIDDACAGFSVEFNTGYSKLDAYRLFLAGIALNWANGFISYYWRKFNGAYGGIGSWASEEEQGGIHPDTENRTQFL